MVHQTPVLRGDGARSPSSPQPHSFSASAWASTPCQTASLLSSFMARARNIQTALGGFIRADRLDSAEAEILAAGAELREMRIHVRQLRAEAKADARRSAA